MTVASRFNAVSATLIAFLLTNLALIDTMLPLNLFVIFADFLASLPVPIIGVVAAACWSVSAPGVGAAFAAFRDAPVLRFNESDEARYVRSQRVAWIPEIADSYWNEGEEHRVLRPYFRSYAALLLRCLRISVVFGALLATLTLGCLLSLTWPSGGPIAAGIAAALGTYTLLAHLVALGLAIEFPRARISGLLRNSFLLVAQRWTMSILLLVAVAAYVCAIVAWPYLTLLFGSSLCIFFGYHATSAITRPLRELMIQEASASRSTDSCHDDN